MSKLKYDALIVGGFGHVGLPLGLVLADAGLQTALYDIDVKKRPLIEAGSMPFMERDAEVMLKRVIGKSLHIANDISDVARAEVVVVTIGTPVDEYLNPRTTPLLKLAEHLIQYLRSEQCLVLRSTIFPGAGKWLTEFFHGRGVRVHVAYCPERIVQGNALEELRTLPQIVSGSSPEAIRLADALFRKLGVSTIEVSMEEAEFAKLFLNSWRYVQFAIANQFYTMATASGADYERVYYAMTSNYDRAKDIPRPGFAAGPCLLKDTLQLAASHGANFQLGHAAMVVNEGLPRFIVHHIQKVHKPNLSGVCVGILGMSFKADIDDIRDSLSYKLAKILRFEGAEVLCSDEHVKDPSFKSREEVIRRSNVIVVGVPHSIYRGLMLPAEKVVIDLWGVTKRAARGEGA